jgi:hypothetical protein
MEAVQMCSDNVIRRFAGVFILISLFLAWGVSPLWLGFTAFVALNLIQSSFTDFCPLERILGRFGFTGCERRADKASERK